MKIKISLIGWYLILIVFVALSLICLAGCKQIQYVPVETVRTERVTEHDSIIIEKIKHDSVQIEKRGDTVYVDRWHTLYKDRWRDRWRDSVRVDSVQVPYPVPAQLSRWQKFCCDYGKIMLGASAALAILLLIILLYWIRYRRNQKRE